MGIRLKTIAVSLFLLTLSSFSLAASVWTTDAEGNPKLDFAPTDTAYISGEGFLPSATISLSITRPDLSVDTCPYGIRCEAPPAADVNGAFSLYPYVLEGIAGEYTITASDGTTTVTFLFTDAICSGISCSSDDTCYNRCDGGYWYYGGGDCKSSCNPGSHCEYDHRTCADSDATDSTPSQGGSIRTCDAECDQYSDCTDTWQCSGKTYQTRSRSCSSSCLCSYGSWTDGSCSQSVANCGAQCDDDSDCASGGKCVNCQCYACTEVLNDGFESSGSAWDDNWDANGATSWFQSSTHHDGGMYSAGASDGHEGSLTSDNLDTSNAEIVSVDFWFRKNNTESSDISLVYYDGSHYDNIAYLDSLGSDDTWLHYNQTITDSQYLKNNFRIRFDASLGNNENAYVDDVLIKKCSLAVCGNGITETGEDCDPGADNPNDCCTADCKFETSSHTCRASAGECDAAETCTGSSESCPADMKSTSMCRASGGDCDASEYCNGIDNDCPANSYEPVGTLCGNERYCPDDGCADPFYYFYPADGHDKCDGNGQCVEYSCIYTSRYCAKVTYQCNAQCESSSDCASYCDGNERYFNGICDTASTCSCSYSSEDCGSQTRDCTLGENCACESGKSICDTGNDKICKNGCTSGSCNSACIPSLCDRTNQGTDSDGDGYDDECETCDTTFCRQSPTAEICDNSCDDDCDGLTDCADPDCAGQTGPNDKICCQSSGTCDDSNACTDDVCSSNECNHENNGYVEQESCGSDNCLGTHARECSGGSFGQWSECSSKGRDCDVCGICDATGYCTYDSSQNSDCSGYSIPDIATCSYDPDGIGSTWDYADGVDSVCAGIGQCSDPDYEQIMHTCEQDLAGSCSGWQCDENDDCPENSCSSTYDDYCVGKRLYEYDNDRIKDSTEVSDSCANSCGQDCACSDCDVDCSAPATSNYCVSGVCNAECDPSVQKRCLPSGTSVTTIINGKCYITPDFDTCRTDCTWGNCQKIEIDMSDPRCNFRVSFPTCGGFSGSACYPKPITIPQIPTVTTTTMSPTSTTAKTTTTVFKITVPTFTLPTFRFR